MKLLALESSGLVASAAIVDDDVLIAEYTTDFKKTHSQTLLPMIDEIVRMTDTDLNSIDAIAVSAGPGSFTGLRIGAATAKGLCLALNKPIIAVPTLDALVYGVGPTEKLVVPIMDARRNQVYTKLNDVSTAMDMHELIAELNKIGREVVFLGDGVPVYRDQIEAELKVSHSYAPAHLNRQRAASLGALALTLEPMNADGFAPEYLRKSQAEREREEKENNTGNVR
ncbi:MAG: tRNA (adenosine(37)-N6)-threonylcarbamoyltransferase complex dimerization subunit type 1 TsaB [Lachnospiraceae bacterium]|nr:tRNA (adenosine(37)-N6)-threonylcarbamoyltransferase complex dimerization subunit type 1 TsaB [Lachnospiraceae bacterium]